MRLDVLYLYQVVASVTRLTSRVSIAWKHVSVNTQGDWRYVTAQVRRSMTDAECK